MYTCVNILYSVKLTNWIELNWISHSFCFFKDNQPPSIRCPYDFTKSAEPGKATRRVEWRQPLATDNQDRFPTVLSFPKNIVSPHQFPIGVTRIVYTATDDSGNSQSCVFTVTIIGENLIGSCVQGRKVRRGLIKKKRFVRGRGELTWRDKSNLPLNKPVQRQSHCSIGQSIKLGSNVIARHEKVLDSVSDFRLICFLRIIEDDASKSWPQLKTSMVPSCENWFLMIYPCLKPLIFLRECRRESTESSRDEVPLNKLSQPPIRATYIKVDYTRCH